MTDPSPPARPSRLFKYLAPDRLDALDGWLRCSPGIVLNDVFEMTTNFVAWSSEQELHALVAEGWPQQLEAALDEEFRKHGLSREAVMAIPGVKELLKAQVKQFGDPTPIVSAIMGGLIPSLNEVASSTLGTKIGVVSFTEQPTSLLMWAHYADKHMGFVIEYDPEHWWFNQRKGPDDEYLWLRPVRYQQQRAALVATNTSGEEVFLTKSADWQYEQEWRILLPIEGCEVRGLDERHGVSVHAVQVPRDAIKCVILGARMAPATREATKDAAKGLTMCEAVPRKDVYGLEVRPLE